MQFILQKSNSELDIDIDLLILRQELNKQKFQHSYTYLTLDEMVNYLKKTSNNKEIKEVIPVGTIEFVSTYLKLVHGVCNMNPIEIPVEMRIDKFLNRDYHIVTADNIPKRGCYFIKDASVLKQFSYCGEMEYFFYDEIFDEPLKKFDTRIHLNRNHLYQVSSVVNILSEYRVFVCDDEIKGIQFYDGNPTIMPLPKEIDVLQEMIMRYMLNKNRPKAYSLDIAIIKSKNDFGRDICVLEVHPFACLGLYGINGSFLPYAYRAGLDYYINVNKKVERYI